MLNYDVLSRKPLIFKSFTGLEVQEFDALYSKTQESHDSYEEKRLHREDRKRRSRFAFLKSFRRLSQDRDRSLWSEEFSDTQETLLSRYQA